MYWPWIFWRPEGTCRRGRAALHSGASRREAQCRIEGILGEKKALAL